MHPSDKRMDDAVNAVMIAVYVTILAAGVVAGLIMLKMGWDFMTETMFG